jgi:N-acetyl-gamma-glutamyl-phosphate reductase
MQKVTVGIAGGTGYTAGELLRILVNHPFVETRFVYSVSQPGKPVASVHTDLTGDTDLRFTDRVEPVDVVFLCLGHGISREFLANHRFDATTRIIDLGSDFRLAPLFDDGQGVVRKFVYGLPELDRAQVAQAQNIANPGCFATAIQLALLPLAASKLISRDVHITGVTGATGAGRSLSETSHFSYRDSNMSVYKVFAHQHLAEIRRTLTQLQGAPLPELNFVPVRGNFTRGIFATLYTELPTATDTDELTSLYRDFYADCPFTHLADRQVNLKDVLNTNKCLLHVAKYGNKAFITAAIDNLLKGASGQAVQNMNLMFGLPEDCGLRLKPTGV